LPLQGRKRGEIAFLEKFPHSKPSPLIIMASILLVDDDNSVLLTSSIALRRRGHEVTLAGDGLQALHQLHRNNFDFVVSDIRMPGMSGLELAERIQDLPNAPRIVLTSAHYDAKMEPNPAAIAAAFLQKPLDFSALCEILEPAPRRVLQRSHAMRKVIAPRLENCL
jgi:DNA-binding NtrC family response regulator